MVNIKPRPEMVNSAENAIKKSINHYFLINYNFPSEAVDCVNQLHLALELLVKERYTRDGIMIPDTVFKIFQDFWGWDINQKDIAHWLRKKRNALLHSGEAHWEEAGKVHRKLLDVYKLAGQTYESLGYKLDEVFTSGEQNILKGQEANWKNEAHILANASFQFYKEDPELAFQISNGALEKAVRGYAYSWRIDGAKILPIPEVVQAMYDNVYEFSTDLPTYYEKDQTKPYYFERETHDYYYIGCDCLTDISELLESVEPYRQDDKIKKALDDNWDKVIGLIKNAPYLDFYECFITNWARILDEFKNNVPEITFPQLNDEHGIQPWWDEDKVISLHFKDGPGINWEDSHKELFTKVVESFCGEMPSDLRFEFSWGDTSKWMRD